METITNAVSAATNAASNLIYGDQTKANDAVETTKNNETAGKEPLSGVEGEGTKSDPFDQGNTTAAPTTASSTTAQKGTFLDYQNNETGGKEPISGAQGQGTAKDPFDQGNDGKVTETDKSTGTEPFLKLDPATKPMTDSSPTGGDPKIYSDGQDTTYTGMTIVPLNPDAKTSNTGTASAPAASETTGITATGITDKAGVSEKVWKDSPLDDISRTGAPGAGPTGPAHVTPAAPTSETTASSDAAIKAVGNSTTRSSDTYAKSSSLTDPTDVLEKRETPEWTSTGVSSSDVHVGDAKAAPPTADPRTAHTAVETPKTGIAEDKTASKTESSKSPELSTYTSSDEKNGKISHLKEKMKNKLHIGSKDK